MNQSEERLSPKELTLNQALMLNKVGLFQYRLLMMCGFAFMADALEVNLLTFLAACAGDDWGLNNAQKASITGIVFAGIIVGTIFFGLFADRYGRKSSYFYACTLISIGGVLSGVSPNYYWLIFFRAIAGFGIGGSNVPFDLLAEFLPTSHRGKFLVYIEYFWSLGSMFVSGIAWASLDSQGWRFLAYITAVPVIIVCIVSSLYLPESPRWLLLKGKRKEAEEVVRAAALVNGIIMEPFRLVEDDTIIQNADNASYIDLLNDRTSRNTSIRLWIIWFSFGFTYYGVILFIGRLYSGTDDDGDDDSVSCTFDYQPIFISAASELAGCTIGALLIDYWGRMKSQTIFYIIAGISAFLMGFETQATAVLLVGLVGRMTSAAAANATWVITPELYSTKMRTIGHASCVTWSKIGGIMVPFFVISSYSTIVVGIVLCLINFIGAFISTTLPETKNKDLDTIEIITTSSSSSLIDTLISRLSFDHNNTKSKDITSMHTCSMLNPLLNVESTENETSHLINN